MVLGRAIRKARGISESLAVLVFEEGQNADADSAGRKRYVRSGGTERGTLSRAEALRGDNGPGALPAGAARVSGNEAPVGYAKANGGLAGEICEGYWSGWGEERQVTNDGQAVEHLKKAYRVLDVPTTASALAIKSNYRKLIKRWHPDRPARGSTTEVEAMTMTKAINEAYTLIENAPLRYF